MECKLEHKLEHLDIHDIKKHIPQHCFLKQPVNGILYIVRDIGIWCLALLLLLHGKFLEILHIYVFMIFYM